MRARAPTLLLTAALAASAALLISFVSHLTFIGDDWELLIGRRDWDVGSFLEPFNENLILGPTFAFKLLLGIFGMGSALPYYVVSVTLFLLAALLLFVYVRRRAGEWPALLGALLILFLGAAYEDLFWALQLGFFGSVATGLGALIALDREDDTGDRWACALLLGSLAFGSVGIPFVAAGLADLAFGRKPRLRRAYITLVPMAAYALWWLGWGHSAGSQVSFETLLNMPGYAFDAAAAGIASVLGREPMTDSGHAPIICQVALIVLILVVGRRVARDRGLPRGMAVALALALAFWLLIGLNRTGHDRFALSSRYQYPSAVFIVLIAAEMIRGVRIPRAAAAVAALITAGAVVGGISIMNDHYENGWRSMADQTRLTVTAVEIAGPSARSSYLVSFPPSVVLPAPRFLDAARRHGSPAYSEAELMERPQRDRLDVDGRLVEALGISLAPTSRNPTRGACRKLLPGTHGDELHLPRSGTVSVTNTGTKPSALKVGRFATGAPVDLGPVPPGAGRSFAIPADESGLRWRLGAVGAPLRLCL